HAAALGGDGSLHGCPLCGWRASDHSDLQERTPECFASQGDSLDIRNPCDWGGGKRCEDRREWLRLWRLRLLQVLSHVQQLWKRRFLVLGWGERSEHARKWGSGHVEAKAVCFTTLFQEEDRIVYLDIRPLTSSLVSVPVVMSSSPSERP